MADVHVQCPIHRVFLPSKLDALSGPDGCILDDTLPTKYLAMCKTLSSLLPFRTSFGSVDLTEPGKRRVISTGRWVDWSRWTKLKTQLLEIGSGENLRHALHTVDVAKGKFNALVGQQHAKDHDGLVDDDNQMEK